LEPFDLGTVFCFKAFPVDLKRVNAGGDTLDDLAWASIHGAAKRLRVVASLVAELGLQAQRMMHGFSGDIAYPRFTREAALALLDARLASTGATCGVTRDEIDEAFVWLTSPYVDRAVWPDASLEALVIRPSLQPASAYDSFK
jgi:hypothetical protein